MMDFYEKTIGPVAYEQEASKIRQAFSLGCSAVIIDGQVPETVRAEITRAPVPRNDNEEFLSKGLFLRSEGDSADDVFWYGGPFPGMRETFHWLMEEARQMVAMKLRPTFDAVDEDQCPMTLWLGRSTNLPWHTDILRQPQWFDMHLHVYGESIKIATATKDPVTVPVSADAACRLKSQFRSVADMAAKTREEQNAILDAELEGLGVRIVTLQPGQKLIFREDCLHRSVSTHSEQIKMRAGMF